MIAFDTPASQQVRVTDRADALADHLDGHHRVFDLLQRAENSFERALGVGLDDKAELLDLAFLGAARQLLERDARRKVPGCFLGALFGKLCQGDLARDLFRAHDLEDCRRPAGPRSYLTATTGVAGGASVTLRPRSVRQRTHAAIDVAANKVVADLERSSLHEHGRDGAAAPLEVSVDDCADRVAVRVCLQLENVRGQDDGCQQVVDAFAGLGAQVNALVLTAVSGA